MKLNNSKLKIYKSILLLFLTSTLLPLASFLLLLSSCDTTNPPEKRGVDTTSQNFTFETYEFGNGFHSSWLNDVWIFNENNAWAVGYIQSDTVSNANILRWNGNEWYVVQYQGQSSGILGIWALDSNHIYFGAIDYIEGKFIEHGFNGFSNGQSIDHIWGSSGGNIWGVGKWGAIVHYNGTEWKKVDFDTQWYFTEITGSSESGIAYAVGNNNSFTSIIVELKPTSQTIIYSREDDSIPPRAAGVSSFNKNSLSCSSKDIWQLNLRTSEYKILKDLPSGYGLTSISGTSINDIYYFGNNAHEGEKLIHFNGKRYTEFTIMEDDFLMFKGSYAVKDLAVLVGFHNHKAYVKMIRRR